MLFALEYPCNLLQEDSILALYLSVTLFIDLDGLLVPHGGFDQVAWQVWAIIVNARTGTHDFAPMLEFMFLEERFLKVTFRMKQIWASGADYCQAGLGVLTLWLNNMQGKVYLIVEVLLGRIDVTNH